MKWILIMAFYTGAASGGVHSNTVAFETQTLCEKAAASVKAARATAICVQVKE